MSSPSELLQQAKTMATQRLTDARSLYTNWRSTSTDTPETFNEYRRNYHLAIRQAANDHVLTIPEITTITGLSRSRIYQILTPAPPTLPSTVVLGLPGGGKIATAADFQLPQETDL